ncbi:MAG: TonB family protein [Sulfitobacter sp.]
MIPSSKLVKLLAGAISLSTLAATLALAVQNDPVQIQGGGQQQQAQLGASFADMTQGVQTPETPDTLDPVEPDLVEPDPVETAQPEPVQPVQSDTAQPLQPQAATPTPPDVVAALKPDTPPETLTATPETGATSLSARPLKRPETLKTPPRRTEATPKKTKPKPKKSAPKGNAKQSAKAGSQSGSNNSAKAKASGTRAASTAGNAAASNYPGKVMRKLSRVRRPSVRARGAARVRFTVAASGQLAGVSIAKSSGSAQLDQAAMQLVRRAAPFPAPPPGAQRSFSINISGK